MPFVAPSPNARDYFIARMLTTFILVIKYWFLLFVVVHILIMYVYFK
jgi:hypothetical protein